MLFIVSAYFKVGVYLRNINRFQVLVMNASAKWLIALLQNELGYQKLVKNNVSFARPASVLTAR